MAEGGSGGRYARTLERELSRVRGRPTILSPRDWALVQDWRRRGIPLGLVLDLLRDAEQRSRRRPGTGVPKSLAYLAPAVEETWKTVEGGRRQGEDAAPSPAPADPADQWRTVAHAAGTAPEMKEVLERLLDARAGGASSIDVDADLDRELLCLQPDRTAEARSRNEARLAPFRGRMSPDVYERTLDRAVADELREELKLPRLDGPGVSH